MKYLIFTLTILYCFDATAFINSLYKQEELSICPNQVIFFNQDKYNAAFIKNEEFNIDISKLKLPKQTGKYLNIYNICIKTLDKELEFLNCLGQAKGKHDINKSHYLNNRVLNIDKFIKQTNKITNKSDYYIISYSSPDFITLYNPMTIDKMIIIDYDQLVKIMPEFKQDLNQDKFFCKKKGS